MFQKNKLAEGLYTLPFDQFSRQAYVSDIIELIRTLNQDKKLTILDIGGYKGKTREFQSNDQVTVADLFDVEEPGYIKIEPEKLPFLDDDYDVSVSFDTFEHVPRNLRLNFLKEAVRVSKSFHILAAPVDNDLRDVNNAEIRANVVYERMKGEEHRWLKEHIDFLIPTRKEIEESFDELGLYYANIQTNEISLWLQLQQFFFCAEIHSECFQQVEYINRFYNEHIKTLEANIDQKVAYRSIYCLTDNEELFDTFVTSFDSLKKGIYSPSNYDNQTQKLLELNQLVHEGYMLLSKSE